MSASLWIALRYLVTRRRQFAAFVTWISVAGLALGVLVLTVVISVMNGFDAELRQRILGSVPHIIIEGQRCSNRCGNASSNKPGISKKAQFLILPIIRPLLIIPSHYRLHLFTTDFFILR